MIRAVAWDVDGTLVDSEPNHHAALMKVSARYGVPIAQNDARFLGVAAEDVWKELRPLYPPTLDFQAWIEEIIAAYIGLTATLAPLPGAREAVETLSRAGVPQSCVSNSARRIVDANLAAIRLAKYFAFTIARQDVQRGKPDPEPYALACHRFGASPSEVLAVEDSDVGAASARAAGLRILRIDPRGDTFSAVVTLVLRDAAAA